ncbi:diguanylate cyclase domain-containing protein [Methylobacterium thuringiense]|nr:diguanylate cyclase [Methylobacterium thuringiense]
MMSALTDEAERLACLASLGILDTPPEREFDTLVRTAQRLLGCPIALVSMVDETRQWFKASCGLDVSETPREDAFCTHALRADDLLIVTDATQDPRFARNPLVTGSPHIRFYAGMPIRIERADSAGRIPVATLCVIDREAREIDETGIAILRDLAQLAEALLAARSTTISLVRLAEERRKDLEALDRSNRQLHQAERMAQIGSWRLCLRTQHTAWSDQTYAIHGVPVGDGTPLETALDFYSPQGRALVEAAVARSLSSGEPFDIETDFRNAQGEDLRVRCMGEVELREGEPVALIGVFQDITERYAMEQALRHTAQTDDLTGIASRSRLNLFLDERIRLARESDVGFTLLIIDLDHFKAVNDAYGHPAGDEVLRVMADKLQSACGESGLAARIGGDEFALVVTEGADDVALPRLLRKLLEDLRYDVRTAGRVITVSGTIGACHFDGTIASRSSLMKKADEALYRAKNFQRGSAAIHGDPTAIMAYIVAPKNIKPPRVAGAARHHGGRVEHGSSEAGSRTVTRPPMPT